MSKTMRSNVDDVAYFRPLTTSEATMIVAGKSPTFHGDEMSDVRVIFDNENVPHHALRTSAALLQFIAAQHDPTPCLLRRSDHY